VIASIKQLMKEIFPDNTSKNRAEFGAGPEGGVSEVEYNVITCFSDLTAKDRSCAGSLVILMPYLICAVWILHGSEADCMRF
jgi:hypothetical protein